MSSRVVRLDLKGCDPEEAVSRVTELLHTPQDLGLLLVEDTAAAVAGHRAAFEALDASRQVTQLLCLVVGRQPAPGGAAGDGGLRLPGNIRQRTLWVIEETGVDWPLSPGARARRRDGRDGDGLGRLSDLLRLPAVFERTHRLLGDVPFGAAVPGLHIAGAAGTGQEDFLRALRAAIRRLLDPAAPAPPAHDDDRAAGRVPVRLVPGGPLQRAFDDAGRALEEAQEAAVELAGVGALVRKLPADVPVRVAGDRLGELRDRLASLFQAVPGDGRITDDRRAAIAAHGVRPPQLERLEAEPFRRTLRGWLREGLGKGTSLVRLDQELRAWAAGLEGGDAPARRLAESCPDALPHRLRNPLPMPPPQPWLAPVGACCAALAGLSPVGVGGGLVMALLWAALVALTVIRAPGGRLEDHSSRQGANALAALGGGIGGGLGGEALALPAGAWAAAVFAAVAGGLAVIAQSWRSRALRWADDAGLDVAERAVQDMQHLLGRTVTGWARLNRRLDEVDELSLLRQGLGGVRAELEERSRELEKEELPGPSRSLAPYSEGVHSLLIALAVEALGPVRHDVPDGEAGRLARKEAALYIDEWESKVEQGLPVDELKFAADAPPVAPPAREDLAFLAEQVAYDPAGEMWQLCAPADLGLLDPASRTHAVRFGPQPHGDGAGFPPGTVLVPSSAHCGVLRLVPLHARVVEWTWTEDEQNGGAA
ncbi:hypothetical protein [Actinomadura decatromicini]|uniref:Uncharacterized protein n=1 Tax=Actinomadura decatromicini TaxID=2604572 RepID=A0A5D3FWZ2_9ACTN|nr:hypothetical protein [Actinomadura decatromicini]TYK52532.1 hypothetical protein FXF68_01795 [Actinomadura decatromicini]